MRALAAPATNCKKAFENLFDPRFYFDPDYVARAAGELFGGMFRGPPTAAWSPLGAIGRPTGAGS